MDPHSKLSILEKIFAHQQSWINYANIGSAIGFFFEAILVGVVLAEGIAIGGFLRGCFMALAVIGLLFYVLAVFPKINRDSHSFLYFGGIVTYDRKEFKELIKSIDEAKLEKEYSDQIFILSKIALAKYLYFRLGLFFSLASLALLIMVAGF